MTVPVATAYRHIEIDEKGRSIIAGTRFKVYQVIEHWQENGWTPEEIHEQFPVLSMSQIHSAFAYYWDHKEEIEQTIEEAERLVEEYRRSMPEPPFVKRLRALKQQKLS